MTARMILRLRTLAVFLTGSLLACSLLVSCGGGGGTSTPVGQAAGITAVQPSTTITGATATFTATVTGTAPLTYAWDFGGGATPNESTAASPSVVLGAAGSYNGTVTVSNTYGAPAVYNFTLTVITGGGGSGTWPSDPTQFAWVTTWYTTLPGLAGGARVFQDANYAGYADDVYTRINAARAAEGVAALTFEPHLEALAQAHCAHMATAGFFSHYNPAGLGPTERLEAINPPASTSGTAENIAAGQDSPESVMTGWLASSAHRDNILDASYTHVGVGVYGRPTGDPQGYGIYWTTVFFNPGSDPATHAWIEPGDTP